MQKFGMIDSENFVVDFKYFYYEFHYQIGYQVGIRLMNRHNKAPEVEPITKATFLDRTTAAIKFMKTVKRQMAGNYEAFRYYLDENRIATYIHAYKKPENISLHLNLSHHNDVEFRFKMCRDSRVEDAYFMAGRHRLNQAKEKDYTFWKTGWEQFARLFSAMLKDVNKPASAFPKSRGLSNRDVLMLTKQCRQHGIRFYMNKDLDGAYLQLGQQKGSPTYHRTLSGIKSSGVPDRQDIQRCIVL